MAYGDGLALAGRTLYVVQNYANQITAVRLAPDLTSGTVAVAFAHPDFAVPTTAAHFGSALYVVNARYVESPPLAPDSPNIGYELLRVALADLP